MRNIIFQISLIIFSVLYAGCSHTDFLDPTNGLANYLSFTDSGCTERGGVGKTTGGSPLCISYNSGVLTVISNLQLECAAKISDSAHIGNGEIKIFYADTKKAGADCICPFVETSRFRIYGTGEYKISVNVKPVGKDEYFLYADTSIVIK